MQDAYLTAAKRLADEEVENMLAWYYGILYFKCLEASRYGRTRFAEQLADDDDALDLVANRNVPFDLRVALREALETLPEDDRRVVEMSDAGFTAGEIAETEGPNVTADVIRQRKSRALSKLRKLLGGTKTWAM